MLFPVDCTSGGFTRAVTAFVTQNSSSDTAPLGFNLKMPQRVSRGWGVPPRSLNILTGVFQPHCGAHFQFQGFRTGAVKTWSQRHVHAHNDWMKRSSILGQRIPSSPQSRACVYAVALHRRRRAQSSRGDRSSTYTPRSCKLGAPHWQIRPPPHSLPAPQIPIKQPISCAKIFFVQRFFSFFF